MESGYILDSQISASSEYNARHTVLNARLNFQAGNGRTGAWSARPLNPHQWLQVDFVRKVTLGQVATQGRPDYAQWVTSYSLSYSVNGVDYEMFEQDSSVKVRVSLPSLYWINGNLVPGSFRCLNPR